ncbi:MAG: RNA-guided endonuclease InsQ/TnpB family protein, partial [Promethearchaeota archaeon]
MVIVNIPEFIIFRIDYGMVMLTRKFTINPTKDQVEILCELANVFRLLYNHALAERKFCYDNYRVSLSYKDQQNALPSLKRKYPLYQQVYSKVLQMALKKLDNAFKAFFGLQKNGEKTAHPPTFRGKNHFFTLCYNQSGFRINKKSIQFSHKHPSRIPLKFKVPFDFTSRKVKQIEIFQDRYEKCFYLAVTYEQDELPYYDNGLYQAFDLGIVKHIGINLQGKFLKTKLKRPDKYWEPKIHSLQRRKDHCKKNSRRYRLFNQRLITIQRRCKNQTKDWQHKQALNLLKNTKANTIIVGNLSPKRMVRNCNVRLNSRNYLKKVNRGVHNTGHLGRFVELLTYKARILGKRVTVIDERDTTKTCSGCGHKKEFMPLNQRKYSCEICGTVLDRDKNSAINIMKRFLSYNALWTSYHIFLKNLDNLRHTANGQTKVPYLQLDGFR